MSENSFQSALRHSLQAYFAELGEQEPSNLFQMVDDAVQAVLLEEVLTRTKGKQIQAARWLGINRNTVAAKLRAYPQAHPKHEQTLASNAPSTTSTMPTASTATETQTTKSRRQNHRRLALLSVSDKTGIVELASGLIQQGYELISTGGTYQTLRNANLSVTALAAFTDAAEILDGRVKTLHPKIHAGLLAKRALHHHAETLQELGFDWIDVLVVNLYPFEKTVAQKNTTLDEAIEQIDIGGPAMVRSAAKNSHQVLVLTDPSQYAQALEQLAAEKLGATERFAYGVAAFERIAAYDLAIAQYLQKFSAAPQTPDKDAPTQATEQQPATSIFPQHFFSHYEKVQDLRYGENPHQAAAFYRTISAKSPQQKTLGCDLTHHQLLQGKALSFNNLMDADAAWECTKALTTLTQATPANIAGTKPSPSSHACVIVKHANPCGAALATSPLAAYRQSRLCDETSAFGGIVSFGSAIDADVAAAVLELFVEVVIAPAFSAAARALFASKPNVRLLCISGFHASQPVAANPTESTAQHLHLRQIGSGLLVQQADKFQLDVASIRTVSRVSPSAAQLQDALFAWKVVRFVKSNAIVYVRNGATIGVGAGQMSRVDAAQIAASKAGRAGIALAGSVVASDAFFPFRDGLDLLAQSGATCIIQPGGSVRDAEVIQAADEHGIALLFTGIRHFWH